MARRGWGGSIAAAAGGAAGAGAAQLGFGYGLGIINWAPADTTAGSTAWVAGLIWATWIAATSTVFGAVCAQRLRDRAPAPDGTAAAPTGTPGSPTGAAPTRPTNGGLVSAALAVAAGLGALITVLLVAVPAREAVAVADTGSPRNVAAGYAALGVLIGVLTAIWALRSRAAANNVIATVGWLWLLAVVAVVDGVLAGRGLTSAQLGIWQLSPDDGRYWIRDYFYWPGALLSLGSALVIGALAARRDARHPDHRVGAAVSGAAGPLLVATAYFLAVPRLTAVSPEQVSAHLTAPYAVIIGIGAAVLVTGLAQRGARRAASRGPVLVPRQRTGEPADATPGRHAHPADGTDAATATFDGTDTPATPDGTAPDRATGPTDGSTTGRDSGTTDGSTTGRATGPTDGSTTGRDGGATDGTATSRDGGASDGESLGARAGGRGAAAARTAVMPGAPAEDGPTASATTGESSVPATGDPAEAPPTGRRPRRRTR